MVFGILTVVAGYIFIKSNGWEFAFGLSLVWLAMERVI